jgi:hypothetical protein
MPLKWGDGGLNPHIEASRLGKLSCLFFRNTSELHQESNGKSTLLFELKEPTSCSRNYSIDTATPWLQFNSAQISHPAKKAPVDYQQVTSYVYCVARKVQ